ncbi:hypothetical protein CFB52_006935 [Burkholderia sp. AU18528]|uniref:hypothetical protein n=1 Tax=Burkholderia sp. AU18528 TaxID=2015350 RepID=UPI000C07AAC0|nr:hypothetical protein [Burkholderia sp. AU18528]PHP89912.1 hypothetical protein CFB52_006935 [Burkholderia sp. AU18528]
MKIASATRFVIPCLAMLVGLLAGFGWRSVADWTDSPIRIDPGTDLLSVLPDEVMSLTFTTAALTLTAQRSQRAARFAVQVTYADGRAPRQCVASPDLAAHLESLSTIVAQRQVDLADVAREFPRQIGRLDIRGRIASEPPPVVFLGAADSDAVAVAVDGLWAGHGGYAAVVRSPSRAALAALAGGCDTLARR